MLHSADEAVRRKACRCAAIPQRDAWQTDRDGHPARQVMQPFQGATLHRHRAPASMRTLPGSDRLPPAKQTPESVFLSWAYTSFTTENGHTCTVCPIRAIAKQSQRLQTCLFQTVSVGVVDARNIHAERSDG